MFALLAQKRFAPLFWTQFLSAFNDNFLKNALVFLIMYKLSGPNAESLITLAGAIFILPFFVLSGLGGQLADRYDKAMIARRLKLAEMLAVLVAVAGSHYGSVPMLFVALALFGRHFDPVRADQIRHPARPSAKIGTARRQRPDRGRDLHRHSAWRDRRRPRLARGRRPVENLGGFMLAVALACYIASRFIPGTGGEAPDLRIDANIFRSTRSLLLDLWSDKRLWITGVMVSLFWMFGAIALSVLPPMIKCAWAARKWW